MNFLELYNHILNINHKSYADLPYPIKEIEFKKKQIISKYDQVENNVYLINSGIVEMTIKSYNSEKIIDFFFAGDMVAGLSSFLLQKKSDVQVTALTDVKLEAISYADLNKAYKMSDEANRFSRIMYQYAYVRKAQREKDFLSKTAEERYAEMFDKNPNYLSQIPVNKIAKYLGIHPESLSRVRAKLNS
jgi:CRP-like cAMP-binding protein